MDGHGVTFKEWLEPQSPAIGAIQDELGCDRAAALTIWLLMRIAGELKDVEDWEE